MLIRAALLFALLLASAAQSQPTPEAQQAEPIQTERAVNRDTEAGRDPEDGAPTVIIPNPSSARNEHQANGVHDGELDESRLSGAERWTVGLTLALIIVGLIQAVIYSLQARRLRQTLVQMRESEERQLRAYVSVERGRIEYGREVEGAPSAALVFKNFGQTPAYDVRIETSVGIMSVPLTANPPTQEGRRARFTLGPGAVLSVMYSYPEPPNLDQVRQILAETLALFVVGRVTYRDAFGRTRHTHFRVMQTGRDFRSDRLVACESGNDAD